MIKYYFLHEDIITLEEKVNQLHERIKELGEEQGEAVQQSTENFGHDDFTQEAIFQQRRLVLSQLNELGNVLKNAIIISPAKNTDVVHIGSVVKLSDGRKVKIGSYLVLAEHDTKNISYSSPLGKELVGKREGDEITFRGKNIKIDTISIE